MAGCYRYAVPVVIAAHDAFGVCFLDYFLERIEMYFMQFAGSHMRVGTDSRVASAFRDAVNGKVLQGRSDTVLLDTFNHLCAQFANQIRIFSVRFQYASPARIAGYVEDRGIHVVVA